MSKQFSFYLHSNNFTITNTFDLNQLKDSQCLVLPCFQWSHLNQNFLNKYQILKEHTSTKDHTIYMRFYENYRTYIIDDQQPPQNNTSIKGSLKGILEEIKNKQITHIVFPFMGYLLNNKNQIALPLEKEQLVKKQVQYCFEEFCRFINTSQYCFNITFLVQDTQDIRAYTIAKNFYTKFLTNTHFGES